MRVLVVGGAGYIGSHMVRLLEKAGHHVVVLDNLSTGFKQAVTSSPLVVGDMGDRSLVESTMREHRIDSVMHFAACALVGESVEHPAKYYQNNVAGTLSLLEAMREVGVGKIVFSSTCATYGIPTEMPIHEGIVQAPVNPYGFSKLVCERMLDDYAQAYDFGFAALRYFNAAGASPAGDIGEDHDPETHLIPIVLQVALEQRDSITVFGEDWPTRDGSCVRDYVHVDDLGMAHLAALERIEPGAGIKVNLGTGHGHTVREVIDVCRQVTGAKIEVKSGARRPGDPPELVADPALAREMLDWTPRYNDLQAIVETAWHWHQGHPGGYGN
ncbi:MAG: UDP-glucose 4-epimerase GalE [Mariniblastus sp.]|nr:UDP-glucose 4-epimerase GalE [Mariniblastus sp.]